MGDGPSRTESLTPKDHHTGSGFFGEFSLKIDSTLSRVEDPDLAPQYVPAIEVDPDLAALYEPAKNFSGKDCIRIGEYLRICSMPVVQGVWFTLSVVSKDHQQPLPNPLALKEISRAYGPDGYGPRQGAKDRSPSFWPSFAGFVAQWTASSFLANPGKMTDTERNNYGDFAAAAGIAVMEMTSLLVDYPEGQREQAFRDMLGIVPETSGEVCRAAASENPVAMCVPRVEQCLISGQ